MLVVDDDIVVFERSRCEESTDDEFERTAFDDEDDNDDADANDDVVDGDDVDDIDAEEDRMVVAEVVEDDDECFERESEGGKTVT